MAYYAQPLTKLEGINICLSSMGEPAINALDDAGIDAQMASDLIDEQSRTVQLIGWHWNREKHSFKPDMQTGAINLPNNVAKVDSVDGSSNIDVVQRGLRLFDRGNNTYSFTDSITLELVVILPFDELPMAARAYIAYNSAMVLQQRILGAESINKDLHEMAAKAWVEVIRDQDEVADANMLKDSWSTVSIIQRGWFRRGAY